MASETPARSMNPFRVLQQYRNFRLFWTGQTTSLVGTWMQSVAIGWLALELSNSALMVGVVSAAGSLPVLLFSLFGGLLADRYDKLRLVMIAQSLLLIEATLLWWFTWSGHMTIEWLVILAAVGGVISAVEIPARQALIIELVPREEIVDAVAINSGGFNLARIIGPSTAALVIAGAGLAWCFALNAVSYFAVLGGMFLIRIPPWVAAEKPITPFEGLKEVARYIRATPVVAGLMGIMGVYSIFGFQYLTMMPVIARDLLRTGASGYGFLLTCVGIGAVSGALMIATLSGRVSRGRMMTVSCYSFGALMIVFSLVRSIPVAAAVLFFLGATMLVNGSVANGLLQTVVPNELRGRVMSAYVLVYVGFTPFGSLLGGAIARAVGVQWAIGLGGAVMILYAAWALWRYPEIRGV